MNSIESLSMGICTLTEMNDEYNEFIPDHPFINVNKHTLKIELSKIILNRKKILDFGQKGRVWVEKNHDVKRVSEKLYSYYKKLGLPC